MRALCDKVKTQQQHCASVHGSLHEATAAATAALETNSSITAQLATAAELPASVHAHSIALTATLAQLGNTDMQLQQQLNMCASQRHVANHVCFVTTHHMQCTHRSTKQ